MAYGLPVVASDWQGPRDVVVDGKTGFLCPNDNPTVFADRLELLAGDPMLRSQLGTAARKRYEAEYTVEKFMERLETAFRALEKR